MIRLNPIVEPTWVDVADGVRFLCDPVGAVVLGMAAGSPFAQRCLKNNFGPEALFTANAIAVAQIVVRAWEGIGDLDGEPIEATADNIASVMMQDAGVMAAFKLRVMVPALTLISEKKASAPLPNGTMAGARDTARAAGKPAKTARSRSTSRKR